MRDYQRKKNNPYRLPPNLYREVKYMVKDYPRLVEEYKTLTDAPEEERCWVKLCTVASKISAIKTAISALLYRLSAAVAAAGADSRISSALSDMADTLATLSGMTAAAGVLSMLVIGMLTRFSDVGVMLR